MATKNLTFRNVGDKWAATFTAEGPSIVQIKRKAQGLCSVYANLADMSPVPIAVFQNPYVQDVIFNLEVPAGIEVTIESAVEVVSAKQFVE